MKRAVIVLLLFAKPLFAECTATLSYSATAQLRSYLVWTITFHNCSALPTFTPNSIGQLILGTSQYTVSIDRFNAPTVLTPDPALVVIEQTGGELDPLDAYYATPAAQFTYVANGATNTWSLNALEALNERNHTFKVGPASAGDQTGQGTANASISAFRVQYSGLLSYTPRFGATTRQSASSFLGKFERNLAVKIDTTDQKHGFIDDNTLTAGAFVPRLSIWPFFSQGKIGAQVRYERPIHASDHNLDATATVAGGLPLFQVVNLFSQKKTLAEPLQLALSYGYRSQRQTTPTASKYNGRVLEGTASYHMYLFTDYRVDLRATTTYNDLNNLPKTSAKTTHQFAAQILYRSTPSGPFGVVASFENGKFGPVATKLRQYFIGVAVANITKPFQTP